MSLNFNYNILNKVERPELFLANPNQSVIGCLKQNTELVFDLYLNNISKMSFKYYKYLDEKENPYYGKIENLMTILAVGISWFQVTSVNEKNDGGNPYLEVECSSLENEFTTKRLTSFGQLGSTEDWDGGLDLYKLYDITNTSKSIIHIVLAELPSWSVGTIDSTINNGWRSFTDDDIDAYSFLTGSVSETYDCIFIFDTFSKTVSAYSLESLNNHTGIILSYRNLIKNINFKSNANDIRTRMAVYGGDDRGNGNLNIVPCNATGTSVIANYDYYIDKMSPGLQIAYNNYKTAYVTNSTKLSTALTTLGNLYNELNDLEYKSPATNSEDWTQYGLTHLLEFQDKYSTIMSESLGNSTIYSQNRAKYNAITAQVNIRKQQVSSKQAQINAQIALRDSYVVKFENYLTLDQRKELSRLAHDTTFTDSSFIATTEMTDKEIIEMQSDLKALAEKKLNRICKPQYTLEVDVANYMNIPEFKSFAGKIQLGSILTVDWDDKGLGRYNVESRVLHIHINFDDLDDFSLTFSSKNSLDGSFALDELQEQVSNTTISQAIGSSSWTTIKNNNNEVNMFISSALNAAKNKIVNSENQSVTFGEYGLQIKQFNKDTGGFDPKQIWMANGMIAFSNDGFETVKMALGEVEVNGVKYYGIVADALIGRLIVGNSLYLQNGDATMTFASNGLTITNGVNTVKIDPTNTNLFQILKGNTKVLYFDSYGNGRFSGILEAAGGTFTGTLSGVDGTFTGTLSGNIITGSTINGSTINGSTINWGAGNSLTTDSVGNPTLSSNQVINLSAPSVMFQNLISGNTLYSNTITTGSLTVNSTLSAYSINVNGTDVSLSGHSHPFSSITGSLYTSSIGISGGGGGRIAFNNGNGVGWDYAESTYQKSSDLRLKCNIQTLGDISNFYMDLKPKSYKFKAGLYKDSTNHGLIAQQVLANLEKHSIDSGMVYIQENYYDQGQYCKEGVHYNFRYEDLHAFHIKMIQMLWDRVNVLENLISAT